MKRRGVVLLVVAGLATAVALFVAGEFLVRGRTSDLVAPAHRVVLAHRGVHQNYQKGGPRSARVDAFRQRSCAPLLRGNVVSFLLRELMILTHV